MAVRTIAEGGGNYNATATWVEGVVPTAADDVIALENGKSGALTITATALCRSVDLTHYKSTVKNSGFKWEVGTSTSNAGLAFKMGSEAKYKPEGAATIIFKSTQTGQKLTPNAETLGTVTFQGGGTFVVEAELTAGEVLHSTCTLNTNGFKCTFASLSSAGSGARTLTLGASAISITGAGTKASGGLNLGGTNLTITTNTATFTLSAASVWCQVEVSTLSGASLALTGSGVAKLVPATGGTTMAAFTRTGTAVKTDGLQLSASITVTGACTLTGNSTVNRLGVESSVPGTTRTITAGSVSLTNVDLEDLAGEGAAKPFTGTSLGDCLGNSGITFDTAKTLYSRAGHGTKWSELAFWSLEPNKGKEEAGAEGGRVPLPQDTVIFDKFGFVSSLGNKAVTMDMPRACRNLEITEGGPTTGGGFALGSFSVYGNVLLTGTLSTGESEPAEVTLRGRSALKLKTAGFAVTALTVSAPGATYTVEGALEVTKALTVSYGAFNHGTANVTTLTYVATGEGTRAIELGTGVLNLTGTGIVWNVTTTGLTLTVGTSTIMITGTGTALKTFTGAGLTYYRGQFTGNNVLITGNNGWTEFLNQTAGVGTNLGMSLAEGSVQTISGAYGGNGISTEKRAKLKAAAGKAKLLKTSGIVSREFLDLEGIVAEGGASWYAGTTPNSKDSGGNEGWKFEAPPAGIAMII